MGTWPLVPLGEVAPLVRRPVDVDPEATYREIGLRSYGKGVFHKAPVSGLELGDKRVFEVAQGDLLFSNVFAWEGAVAVAGHSEQGMIGSHRFITCIAQADRAVPEFLKYFFMVPAGLAQLQAASPGGAGRNRTLGLDGLARIRVPLPSLPEQRRIVERLDAVAARLTNRQSTLQDQQRDLDALLHAAFAGITAGAPRARMGDIAPLVRRPVTIRPESLYTEIGVRSFYKGIFHRRTIAGSEFTWQDLFEIAECDIVFSNLMAWEGAIGLAGSHDAHCVGNHRMLTCQPDPTRAVPNVLHFYFTTREGFAQIDAGSPGSIARNKTLSPAALQAIDVPVPSLDAQYWFDQLHAKVTELRAHHAAITADCDALLPAMLNEIFG